MTASTEPQPQREIIAELLARHFCPEYGDPAYVAECERGGLKIPEPVDQSTMVSFVAEDGHRSLSCLTFGDIADALVSNGWEPVAQLRDAVSSTLAELERLLTEAIESAGRDKGEDECESPSECHAAAATFAYTRAIRALKTATGVTE